MPQQDQSGASSWHAITQRVMKRAGVTLAAHVPDNVFLPLFQAFEADPDMSIIGAAREEEAVGIVTGAWLGGRLGVVLMQTSGFATLTNALGSLVIPFQIPLIMIISERGTLGEFNPAQTMGNRTMRPMLDVLGIAHHTIRRLDEVEFIIERTIGQAISTQSPAALILNPQLTGGKTEAKKI